jgi:UDP-N-acetylglucosamine 2-epimerase
VLVQGDTTTVWAAALGAFYNGVKVGHIEAGLRTYDKRQPFPEEINRRLCTQLTDLHFAPTPQARENLLKENVAADHVVVTGNPVIDALLWVVQRLQQHPPADVQELGEWASRSFDRRRMVLITGHRRESFGEGFQNICQAIHDLAAAHPDVVWVYPVHLNPNVQQPVRAVLGGLPNVFLREPAPYAQFTWLMQRSCAILTDSGGVQEEAPSLGKPVLVMRNTTERPEGVAAGCAELVGNRRDGIVAAMQRTLAAVAAGHVRVPANPYGDGQASRHILEALALRAG